MQCIDKIEKIKAVADNIRKDIIEMTFSAGRNGAHIGGGLSMVEILSVLYFHALNVNHKEMDNEIRDRFILSKGHGAIALYSALRHSGFLTEEELYSFKNTGSKFWTHPKKNLKYGIEFSSGSLGMGLSLGAGTAIGLKKKNNPSRVYVYIGDGECNEGSIWEAAAFVAHQNLDNITVIIDRNRLQLDAPTNEIISMENMTERWKVFGFDTIEIDGHSIPELINAFNKKSSKPIAIIANTVKGKGVSFIENNPVWHMGVLSQEQYELAMKEQVV